MSLGFLAVHWGGGDVHVIEAPKKYSLTYMWKYVFWVLDFWKYFLNWSSFNKTEKTRFSYEFILQIYKQRLCKAKTIK